MYAIAVLQWLLFLLAGSGAIGFDHPGWAGLDFNAFLVVAAIYIVVSVVGLCSGAISCVIDRDRASIAGFAVVLLTMLTHLLLGIYVVPI